MSKPKLNSLQMGRGFASLSVLLFHTEVTLALPKYFGHAVFPVLGQGDSGVHYFFVLSGFVIYWAHRSDIGQSRQISGFLWKRFRRLYPPLWIVLLLVLPVFFLEPSLGRGTETAYSVIVPAFLISPSIHNWLLAPEWTLRREVLFYCIFAITIWKPYLGGALSVCWLVMAASLWSVAWEPAGNPIVSSYDLLFGFGVLAAWLFARGFNYVPRVLVAAGASVFMLTWWMLYHFCHANYAVSTWAYGTGAMLMILGGVTWETRTRMAIPRPLIFLGEASYSIYLVHTPAISLLCKGLIPLQRRLPLSESAYFVACAILSAFCGIVFHVLVEKPLLRLLPGPLMLRNVAADHKLGNLRTGA